MKRIYSLLTIVFFGTIIFSCSKDKSEPAPNPEPTPNVVEVSATTLAGTWQLVEAEENGQKLSQLTNADEKKRWECNKKGTISFSSSVVKITRYDYDEDDASCDSDELYGNYVVENKKIFTIDENSKKQYLFTPSIVGNDLTLTREGENAKLIYRKLSSAQPVAPTATAIISVTGTSMENIKIVMLDKSSGSAIVLEEKDLTAGKTSFDVKNYIGKELYFVARDKTTRENASEEIKTTIAKGENAITLAVAKKDYTAKISVNKNNVPQSGQVVYALSSTEAMLLSTFVNYQYATNLAQTFKVKAQTNSQGVATFENLKPQISNLTEYTFIVLKDTAPYYSSVKLNMNGVAQSGVIDISGSGSSSGGNTTLPKGSASLRFWLSGEKGEIILDASVEVGGVTQMTNTNGMTTFTGLPENTTINYVITTKTCKKQIKGTYLTGGANSTTTVRLSDVDPEEGKITLQNKSSNPYTITIGANTWVMEGKSTRTILTKLNTSYTINWKQNSGYVFYPTTGSKTISPTCSNKNVEVSFP